MGSGSRFCIERMHGNFFVGIAISRFPHAVSISIGLAFVSIYIGFGKGYDE